MKDSSMLALHFLWSIALAILVSYVLVELIGILDAEGLVVVFLISWAIIFIIMTGPVIGKGIKEYNKRLIKKRDREWAEYRKQHEQKLYRKQLEQKLKSNNHGGTLESNRK